MARKQVPRDLPPLGKIFKGKPAISHDGIRKITLLEKLRKAARLLRQKESTSFYAMRDVAAYFEVPLRTVAIVYEKLEHEGILSRIRGSRTILEGRTIRPRKLIRGVVGVPLWLNTLVISPYSRALHSELEHRLRLNGYVADPIFFRSGEIESPDFIELLLSHNLDRIIWHSPPPAASNALLTLQDNGVRLITIQATENVFTANVPTYLQDWESAYVKMAGVWRDCGIRRIIVPEPVYPPSKVALKVFANTMTRLGFHVAVVKGNAEDLHRALAAGGRTMMPGVAFMDQQGADVICNEEPVLMHKIIKKFRLAFCRGPIRLPYFNHRDAEVDIVGFSSREIAERVVHDLNRLPHTHAGVIHTFKAFFRPRVNLQSIAEKL